MLDDLDVCSKVVKTLDNIFIDLVTDFANEKVTGDVDRLGDLLEATDRYLNKRELLPALEESLGAFKSASNDARLRSKEYTDLTEALRCLAQELEAYRDELGRGVRTGVGLTKEWNLQTLVERATRAEYRKDLFPIPIKDVANRVRDNQNFNISDNIHRLIGTVRTQANPLVTRAG